MARLAFRLAVALLAFLLGLSAEHFVRYRRSRLIEHRPTGVLHANQSYNQGTDSASNSGELESQADSVAHTVARLHQLKTMRANVPPAARPLLTSLKHQLRDLIAETITAQNGESASAESLRRQLWDRLAAHGVIVEQPSDGPTDFDSVESSYSFGDLYDIEVEKPKGFSDLLVVTTTVGIPCGSDTSLYLFQRKDDKWNLVLAQEANEYENVSGAQGLFSYAISRTDSENKFFVVTANVNPWCSSNWQAIRYSVLRIGATAYQPWILAAGEETIYLGVEPPVYKLEVGEKWFSISFEGNSSNADIANGINSRKHVVKYLIQGEGTRRVSG